MHFLILAALAGLILAGIAYLIGHTHGKAAAVISADEAKVVTTVKTDAQKLDGSVIAALHTAETDGKVAVGTVKDYVEQHL